jgi:hypothetical protein
MTLHIHTVGGSMASDTFRSELLDDVFFTRWSVVPTREALQEVDARMELARQRAGRPLVHVAILAAEPSAAQEEALDIDPMLQAALKHCAACYLLMPQGAWLVHEGAHPQHQAQQVVMGGTRLRTRLAREAVRVQEGTAGLAEDLGRRLKWDGADLLRRARERGLLA